MPTRRLLPLALLLAGSLLLSPPIPHVRAWAEWYVDDAGTDSPGCGAPIDPCRTIQYAINKAADDDTIRLQPGTYSAATNGEGFPIEVQKGMTINGSGRDVTMIDADNPGLDVFYVHGNSFIFNLYGVSIGGGNRGLAIEGTLSSLINGLVDNIRAAGNQTGIYTVRFIGNIEDSDISGNAHAGIHNYSSFPDIKRNILGGNGSASLGYPLDAAIYNDESSPRTINNVIGWNDGNGIWNDDAAPIITNNTIAFNLGGGGIANWNGSHTVVTNNIIVWNGTYGLLADATSSSFNTYNDVWGNLWGDYYGTVAGGASISADPRFVGLFDAHLLCHSPAINTGANAAAQVPSDDVEQKPRPIGGTVDMGAYEWQSPFRCPAYLPAVLR